jgi:hypothetical protein
MSFTIHQATHARKGNPQNKVSLGTDFAQGACKKTAHFPKRIHADVKCSPKKGLAKKAALG